MEAYNPTTYYNPKQSAYEIPGLNSQYSSLAQTSANLFQNDSIYKPDYTQSTYDSSQSYLNSSVPGPPLPVPHPTSTGADAPNFDSTWNMDMSWMSNNSYNESDASSNFINESACGVAENDDKFPNEQPAEDVDHRQILIPEETQVVNLPILKSIFC